MDKKSSAYFCFFFLMIGAELFLFESLTLEISSIERKRKTKLKRSPQPVKDSSIFYLNYFSLFLDILVFGKIIQFVKDRNKKEKRK